MNSIYFKREEFECRCLCGFSTVDVELLSVLERIRSTFSKPVSISSACRCSEHNEAVGGKKGSKHLQGIAADITVEDVDPNTVYTYLDSLYPNKYGLGDYKSFTHIDVRGSKARW